MAIDGHVRPAVGANSLSAALWFWPTSRSYTGQPAAELHTIGSPPLLDAVVSELCRNGARLAQPGEFTLRAFLAGRLDLTQAEAVLGVISARSSSQLDAAVAQLAGGLGGPLRELRGELLDLLAEVEAGLDFGDDDVPPISPARLVARLDSARERAQQHQVRLQARNESSTLPRVVLVGATNAGKSRLFNALTGGKALVSSQPGTTRDFLIARLALVACECELVDTAGAWEHPRESSIDTAAWAATVDQRQAADMELCCIDGSRDITAEEAAELSQPAAGVRLIVLTKCDQPRAARLPSADAATSSVTGLGLDELRRALSERLATIDHGRETVVAATAQRCGRALEMAHESLTSAIEAAAIDNQEELVAGELRVTLEALGEVVGAVYTDDVLDRIFSKFCIGK